MDFTFGDTGILDSADSDSDGYCQLVDVAPSFLPVTVSGAVDSILKTQNGIFKEPNYSYLARVHAEMIEADKTSEEIALWTGEALNISAWKEGKFHGKRGVISTPETPEERQRFKKFIEALGVTYETDKGIEYDNANGPSKVQPQYFLLDGFVQNAWFGEKNMLKRDKKLKKILFALVNMKDEKMRQEYLTRQMGLDVIDNWSNLNVGFRFPLKSSSHESGLFIGGSFFKGEDGVTSKMVNVLGISQQQHDYYENTAATGRLCIVR